LRFDLLVWLKLHQAVTIEKIAQRSHLNHARSCSQ